jgi:hypothetical protein
MSPRFCWPMLAPSRSQDAPIGNCRRLLSFLKYRQGGSFVKVGAAGGCGPLRISIPYGDAPHESPPAWAASRMHRLPRASHPFPQNDIVHGELGEINQRGGQEWEEKFRSICPGCKCAALWHIRIHHGGLHAGWPEGGSMVCELPRSGGTNSSVCIFIVRRGVGLNAEDYRHGPGWVGLWRDHAKKIVDDESLHATVMLRVVVWWAGL